MNPIADGVPLAGIKDPTQCLLICEGHGGWDSSYVDPKAVVATDWTGSTDLHNKWHLGYGMSTESFLLTSKSYSGVSYIHDNLPFSPDGESVAYCDGHQSLVPFAADDGTPNLCNALPWPKTMDPQQRGADKDSCSDPKNPVGAGWGKSNWF